MTIREATDDDKAQVLELSHWFLRESIYSQFPGDDAQMERTFYAILDYGAIFVAEEDGELVGFLAVAALPHLFSGEVYAEELAWFVRPDRRGTAAGPGLQAAAEEWTRQKDLVGLKMVAPIGSPAVDRFYQRKGFEALETVYLKRF